MKFQKTVSCILMFTIFGIPITAAAKNSTAQGAVIVRIDDGAGNGRCINSSDILTVTLRRVILEKNSRWLGMIEDKELGVTLTTTVNGTSSDEPQTASFAKVVKEQVAQFGTGQISLAQEQSLLNKFSLSKGQSIFSVVDLDVGIVRTSGKSVGAQILLGAVGATKNLSLPSNPFAPAYGVATAYVTSVFEPLLDQAASEKEAVSHHIVMNINSANCAADDEKTGTKAIIDASDDSTQPGYIDTGKINSYCFKAELKPAFVLKFAPLPGNGSCSQVSNFTDLKNSYLAFYVNSFPPVVPLKDKSVTSADAIDPFSKALMSSTSASKVAKSFNVKTETVNAYREALKRCQANGTSLRSCI